MHYRITADRSAAQRRGHRDWGGPKFLLKNRKEEATRGTNQAEQPSDPQ
jgi:hypothetical protein